MFVAKIKVTFIDELLGGLPNNTEIWDEFIASKAPDAMKREEEVAYLGADAVADKGKTIFPRTAEDIPFIFDYQWRGFFKEKMKYLRKVEGTVCSTIKAYRQEIDGLVFVRDRVNPIFMIGGDEIKTVDTIVDADGVERSIEEIAKKMKNDPDYVSGETMKKINTPEEAKKIFSDPHYRRAVITQLSRPLRASTPQGDMVAIACSECIQAGASCIFAVGSPLDEYKGAIKECLDWGRFSGTLQWRNSGKGRFVYEVIAGDLGQTKTVGDQLAEMFAALEDPTAAADAFCRPLENVTAKKSTKKATKKEEDGAEKPKKTRKKKTEAAE